MGLQKNCYNRLLMKELSHKGVGPPRTFLGSSNTKNSVNAVFNIAPNIMWVHT